MAVCGSQTWNHYAYELCGSTQIEKGGSPLETGQPTGGGGATGHGRVRVALPHVPQLDGLVLAVGDEVAAIALGIDVRHALCKQITLF